MQVFKSAGPDPVALVRWRNSYSRSDPDAPRRLLGANGKYFREVDMVGKELASWIRKEHEQVELLSNRLGERVAVLSRGRSEIWIRETRDCFDQFCTHLQQHIALEENDGYMQAVLDRRPTLSRRVERLEQEHRDLVRLMRELSDLASDLASELAAPRGLLLRDFCQRVQCLLSYVEHHENEENDLVELVFTDDIGTKD